MVTIGGGSGQFALLSSIRDLERVSVTAVVSMTDSGGSTGRLRDEMGILPPGDVLKCILALSPHRESARELLLKRFESSERLAGHNAGNMLLTMLSQYTGSFPEGINALCEILNVRGTILPVTVDRATLVARLSNGERVFGERAIDLPRGNQREKIETVFLVPHHTETISVYPPVIDKISDADLVLIGPGDLYTSIIPNLLVPGVADALRQTPARLAYILNIMTKFGETEEFSGEDFIDVVEKHIGRKIDEIIQNSQRPPPEVVEAYAAQKSIFVDFRDPRWIEETYRLVATNLLEDSHGLLRHDAVKLAEALRRVIWP